MKPELTVRYDAMKFLSLEEVIDILWSYANQEYSVHLDGDRQMMVITK
jgi:hypothetical protein